ncbi:pilus assembly protein PilP [Desulfococcaceae bacterium HSG7]|nr:pilus assembly protein PilP [Desulfococcaceae bacterium HSG7]
MHLLIKLSSLITIIFYIFIWGGCGSEESPEPQKTATKKINIPPPTASNENIAQDSDTSPEPQKTATKKINIPPPTASNENIVQDSDIPPEPQKTVTKKINFKPPPAGSGTPPKPQKTATKKINIPPPTASNENIVQDNDIPPVPSQQKPSEPVISDDAEKTDLKKIPEIVSNDSKPSQSSTGKKNITPSIKDSTKPKDNSIKKITPETDVSQFSQKDDTENQDSGIETHLSDIQSDVEASMGSEETTSYYNPKGRIDPFAPFIKPKKELKAKPKKQRHRGPLEQFDIDQLQLVGIIRAPSGNLALVQLADGKGYIIQKGTPIGIKEGHIVEISADQVVVEEEGVDSHNDPITIERLMKIKKPIGEL